MTTNNEKQKWIHLDDKLGYSPGYFNVLKTHKFILLAISIFIFGMIKGRIYHDHSYSALIAVTIVILLIPATIECYHSRFLVAKLFSYVVIIFLFISAALWVLGSRGGIFPLW